jgi:hypothetical protein
MRAIIKECLGKMEACLEKKEPAPGETEAMEKSWEVPEGAMDEVTIGAAKDQSRDLHLAIGCCGQLKTRTKHDGGSRQECAAVGRPTHRPVPAMRKGGLCRGPGKKCRSGTGQNKVSRTGKRGRIVKWDRRLDRKKTHSEAIRKSPCMEITKLIFESSVRLREPGDGLLWKCRPLPKRKR